MTTAHVFIATSLDGFIARPDGTLDWLLGAGKGEDHGYDAFIGQMDGMIMGRLTYESVQEMGGWAYPVPVHVLTSRPAPATAPDMVTFGPESPAEAMELAGKRGWRRLYLDGGAVIRSFLREGLVADMIVTRIPVLIGSGRPLFGDLPGDIPLTHEWTRDFPSGLVQSKYRIAP